MGLTVAVSGDSILTRRLAPCTDEGFRRLIEKIRAADVAHTHLETLIHDYDGREVYPAAEAGGLWLRSPRYVADELAWAGFDLLSHASNHALDYAYGGLASTWDSLDETGLAYAGTGSTMSDAAAPAYVDTFAGRVALVSMTSSFPRWARAGHARHDMKGRPGVNTLGYHYEVPPQLFDSMTALAESLGLWMNRLSDSRREIHRPGLHNSTFEFSRAEDAERVTTVVDAEDRARNLGVIKDAATQADLVIVQAHVHAWAPDEGLGSPPSFLQRFARDCIDAGTDLFLAEGSHAPIRGLEVYRGKPIFYDPGDLIRTSNDNPMTRYPAEFYFNNSGSLDSDPRSALPSEGFAAYKDRDVINPPGGYRSGPVDGFVIPICDFDDSLGLERISLHPGIHLERPTGLTGLPTEPGRDQSEAIVDHLADQSEAYGTDIEYEDGIGLVHL